MKGGACMIEIKRGNIVIADLNGATGSEQGKMRPVIVIQNDTGNKYSPTTIVVPLTSKKKKKGLKTHVLIEKTEENGLTEDSIALCEQVRTIDKRRIKAGIGYISELSVMRDIYNGYIANFIG